VIYTWFTPNLLLIETELTEAWNQAGDLHLVYTGFTAELDGAYGGVELGKRFTPCLHRIYC
jgi:hypothetical protein